MAMPLTVPRHTIRDLESFPEDGNKYELLDGVLLVTPGPAPLHQRVVSRLCGYLFDYLRVGEGAEILTPGAIQVEPYTQLEPDILVVPTEALPASFDPDPGWTSIKTWWLAVEVSGKASRFYDRDYKGPAYLALGVREFWRADLKDHCLYVSRPGQPPEEPHSDTVTWQPPGRSEPLVIPVPDLFP